MNHYHTDDRLTFGCPACIYAVERDRIDNAPLRNTRWLCSYCYVPEGESAIITATVTVGMVCRVPDGWTSDQIVTEYDCDIGELFVMALPDTVPHDETEYACMTMIVDRVTIGDIIRPPSDWEQETLL